jgi:hypothetical protein
MNDQWKPLPSQNRGKNRNYPRNSPRATTNVVRCPCTHICKQNKLVEVLYCPLRSLKPLESNPSGKAASQQIAKQSNTEEERSA